ncbi:MAG TPA: hypothetical protein VGB77_07460 [Abditibacteriaceae bacterium]
MSQKQLQRVLLTYCLLSTMTLGWTQQQSGPLGVSSSVAIPVAPVIAPSRAPEATGLADIIRAKFPLAVSFKEFGFGWRELNWQNENYLTRGETHWLSGREYLITYKIAPQELRNLSENDYIAAVTGNGYPFAPDARFELTLLAMEDLIGMVTNGATGLRSFDPTRNRVPFNIRSASPAFHQNLSLIYLRKIQAALSEYENAFLQTLPPLESAFAARQALLPYAENIAIFTQPGTEQPFKANPLFSGRKREHLRKRGRCVLFYEAAPAGDGLRTVLLVNGTVRRVDAKAWNELKEISELK